MEPIFQGYTRKKGWLTIAGFDLQCKTGWFGVPAFAYCANLPVMEFWVADPQ